MVQIEPHQRMYNRTQEPTEADILAFISDALAITVWNQLRHFLDTYYDLLVETLYYGDKYGWLVRYRKGRRTIVSIFPEKKSISVLIVYGKKEIDTFINQESEFQSDTVEIFQNTKKLHDGKWLWIRMSDSRFLEDVKRLIIIKRKPKTKS